jgi:hypothetical protein
MMITDKKLSTEIDDWCWDDRAVQLLEDSKEKLFGGGT